jgi:hypothetical protein
MGVGQNSAIKRGADFARMAQWTIANFMEISIV